MIQDLKAQAEFYLIRSLTLENAVTLFRAAELFEADQLVEETVKFIGRNRRCRRELSLEAVLGEAIPKKGATRKLLEWVWKN